MHRVGKQTQGTETSQYLEEKKVMTVPAEAAAANYVPAAAVIRRQQALFGVTGRKGCVGGLVSLV